MINKPTVILSEAKDLKNPTRLRMAAKQSFISYNRDSETYILRVSSFYIIFAIA
jgi:hypothetical protein